jgi:hypothetical protein
LKTLQGFIVGKWGAKTLTDPNVAKALHVESIAREQADSDVTDYFTFKTDGTFICRVSSFAHKVEGKWTANDTGLMLSFDTIDGQPIAQVMAQVKKDEEGGTQAGIATAFVYEGAQNRMSLLNAWVLGDDKKTLKKYEPAGSGLTITPGPNTLVRMAMEDKDKGS